MNAPDQVLKIPLAPGVFMLRPAPSKARTSRRRAAWLLLTALRRAKRAHGGKMGRTYRKEIRVARHVR